MTILITGASGFLGRKLMRFACWPDPVIGTHGRNPIPGSRPLDLASEQNIAQLIQEIRPRWVIHTAAMTDVDACEREPGLATKINSRATALLAEACRQQGSKLIYVSTDYVFAGEKERYDVDTTPDPLSHYGLSKWEGERHTLAVAGNAVVRVAILYGYNGSDDKVTVVSKIVNALRAGKPIHLDGLRIKYPTLIDDVASAIHQVMERNLDGVFHVCAPTPLTRYQWGQHIAEAFHLDVNLVVRDDSVEQGGLAKRPRNVWMPDRRLKLRHTPLDQALAGIKAAMEENS